MKVLALKLLAVELLELSAFKTAIISATKQEYSYIRMHIHIYVRMYVYTYMHARNRDGWDGIL